MPLLTSEFELTTGQKPQTNQTATREHLVRLSTRTRGMKCDTRRLAPEAFQLGPVDRHGKIIFIDDLSKRVVRFREARPGELLSGEATARHRPGDVQTVAPQNLTTQTGLPNGIKPFDWRAVFVERLKLRVDGSAALSGCEAGSGRAEQRPASVEPCATNCKSLFVRFFQRATK